MYQVKFVLFEKNHRTAIANGSFILRRYSLEAIYEELEKKVTMAINKAYTVLLGIKTPDGEIYEGNLDITVSPPAPQFAEFSEN